MRKFFKKVGYLKITLIVILVLLSVSVGLYLRHNKLKSEKASAFLAFCPASESSCAPTSDDLRFLGFDYLMADRYGYQGGGGSGGYEDLSPINCTGEVIFQGGRKVCKTITDMQLAKSATRNCYTMGLPPAELSKCANGQVFSRETYSDMGDVVDDYQGQMGSFGFNGLTPEERRQIDSLGQEQQNYVAPETIQANTIEVQSLEKSLDCVIFQYPEYIPASADQMYVALASGCDQTPKKLNLWVDGVSVGKCKNQDACAATVALPNIKKAGESYKVDAVYNYGILGLAKKEVSVTIPVR